MALSRDKGSYRITSKELFGKLNGDSQSGRLQVDVKMRENFLSIQKGHIDALKELSVAAHTLGDDVLQEYKKDLVTAYLIRQVETGFLNLFSQGKMNGTVHTCIGQELTGVAVSRALFENDWITSNHRCHGHFIAKTGRWQELIDELLGLETGVSGGIGSSQHLFDPSGFISNGTQGSLLPVATGIAYSFVRDELKNVAVSFIGEGTLGEGNIYEAMNLAATLGVPQVIVCENNFYSQSTPQAENFRGSIQLRAEGFGWDYFECDTWDVDRLFKTCSIAISSAREHQKPVFINIKTYRLNAHSKGDDDRPPEEVQFFFDHDPLNLINKAGLLEEEFLDIAKRVADYIANASSKSDRYSLKKYLGDQLPRATSTKKEPLKNPKMKLVKALRDSIGASLASGGYIVGEDIHDPYGGAFKVTMGLDDAYPGQVVSSPISEAAITGMGIGLSMMGKTSFVEIMFGDFIMNAMDQLVNNASKFYHMYAQQTGTSVIVRTPMGGGRGYGPTHSQSLEKFLLGIDNVAVFAVTSLVDPTHLLRSVTGLECPTILLENKLDYGSSLYQRPDDLPVDVNVIGGDAGSLLVEPWSKKYDVDVVLITYGRMGKVVVDQLVEIFKKSDVLVEVVVVQQLYPLPFGHFERRAAEVGKVLTIEEGSAPFGWGAEVTRQLREHPRTKHVKALSLGARPVPIPSERTLEDEVLVGVRDIVDALKRLVGES